MSIRVIAGRFGSRRLTAGRGVSIRPTADRVRESVFALLDARGAIRGARVADLCAGAGTLGIEALSRGAASVVFVDSSPRSRETLNANLAALGLASRGEDAAVRVVPADAREAIRRGLLGGEVDLVFADPPYA